MSIKVMIVDDSPFSRMMIREILTEGGCDVVGEAGSIEELIETYNQCKPDIVTMDIAMPGADGFECSRELRVNDPHAKIILVSSMKDDETETEAKRIGVSGYIQKPVDGEVLLKVINNIMSPDSQYEQLVASGIETFKEALSQNVTRMAKTPVAFIAVDEDGLYMSKGITTVIGIIGQTSGSMMLDLSVPTAEKIAEALMRRPAKSREEVLEMVAELANIIAGIACSMLNKKDKALGLRVSPPSLFQGSSAEIVSPNIKMQKIIAATDYGNIYLSVGFKRGSILWM